MCLELIDMRQRKHLLEIMESLDHQMRCVAVEMMSSGYFPLMVEGDELMDMAVQFRSWVVSIKKEFAL